MSKRRRAAPKRDKSCPTQKLRLPDRSSAEDMIRGLRYANRGREYLPSRAYPCTYCGGWHLTSEEERGY
jgi:hypothetical protein